VSLGVWEAIVIDNVRFEGLRWREPA